jgi:acyl transferase domain-containing protein
VRISALADQFPAFRAAFDECTDVLSQRLRCNLRVFFTPGWHQATDAAAMQSALFVLEVALARAWIGLGVEPAAVIGHSAGEVAAAHVSGALSLEQAADVIVARGRAIRGVAGTGRMVFARLAADEATALLARVAAGIEIAAVNSQRSLVLSGPVSAFGPLLAEFADRGIYHRPLDAVSYASHSAAMDGPSALLGETLAGLKPAEAAVPFVSTVTGSQLAGGELDGRYWARNLRERVSFSDAIAGLLGAGYRSFLEIGPQRALAAAIAEDAGRLHASVATVASMAAGVASESGFLAAAAALYTAGHRLEWRALYPHGGQQD